MSGGGRGARSEPVAVIGMAGRFPGAESIERLWQNLRDGVEGLSTFEYDDLIEAGVDPDLARDPAYVPVGGALDGAEMFAASFFGYSAREALTLDPQQRHFLECSWEALENAGYGAPPPSTGIFGAVSVSTYLLNRLVWRPDILTGGPTALETTIGTDKDFLASRVAFKLDVHGPAVAIQTACSSSLVAVHLACRALQAGDCELALAGGASIDVPQKAGYLYRQEGIYSSDGHCRPFDAKADGMVGGSGAGVVVLKRLDDAIRDRDNIHAVILGSAVNNDGADKVGYSAPSVSAQADVIAAAHRSAGVDPESIGYVEAHGTGTHLGDPIEVTALTQAFGDAKRGGRALGAVKSSLGHLNAAAGVTGLIKAILTVREGEIPPTLHFETPNPHLRLDESPFFVNRELMPWPTSGRPRRAGVSSFGMGGTNAHVVVEQAPAREPSSTPQPADDGRPQILVLSARTSGALEASKQRLSAALADESGLDVRDVAFTLQAGRKAFDKRAAVVCRTTQEAAQRLAEGRSILGGTVADASPKVAFLFPGQGAQHPGMARDLYRSQTVFRMAVDRCLELLRDELPVDLGGLILADEPDDEKAASLTETRIAQPALFTVQFALAELWRSLGVRPGALIGHSIGEYTAAAISGVFTLEDALALVTTRGRLVQALPAGSMLAVPIPEGELAPRLRDGIAVAAVNDPATTVVSGPSEAIDQLARDLESDGVTSHALHTSHAFHSSMMEPAADALREAVARSTLEPPAIPFVSNVTGTWITDAQATDPSYWAEHLLRPVRFLDGVSALAEGRVRALVEVGPGTTLASLARRHPRRRDFGTIVSSLPHPKAGGDGDRSFAEAVTTLWTVGVEIGWERLRSEPPPRRVPLPTYPFERQRFWVDRAPAGVSADGFAGGVGAGGRLPPEAWCSVPSWRRVARPPLAEAAPEWPVILFDTDGALATGLREAWRRGGRVIEVRAGDEFADDGDGRYRLDPWSEDDYRRLFAEVGHPKRLTVVHTWAAGASPGLRGFDSLLLAARAFGDRLDRCDWLIVTDSVHEVTGGESHEPLQATALGPCRVIPSEYEGHRCRNLDVSFPRESAPVGPWIDAVLRELDLDAPVSTVAYRGRHRWVPALSALGRDGTRSLPSPLVDGLRCLVTGGLQGVGAALAEAIAERCAAHIALLSRTPLPRDAGSGASQPAKVREGLATVARLESLGARVLPLVADVSDRASLEAALGVARSELGGLDLIVHAAGVAGGRAIGLKSLADAHAVLAPKVDGTLNLWSLTRDDEPAHFVLCSSLATELGGYGQVDYCAANAFQDAFAGHAGLDGTRVLAIDWDTWSETGMALHTEVPEELRAERDSALRDGLRTAEAKAVFLDLLGSEERRVLVSTTPLAPRLETAAGARPSRSREQVAAELSSPRPEISSDYLEPRSETEREIAEHWQQLLGLEKVGVEDDFLELGGHSLLGTELLNRLRKRYPGVDLTLATLFERSTIASLASLIEEAGGDGQDAAGPPLSADAAEDLLARLDELSDDEVSAALEGLLGEAGEEG